MRARLACVFVCTVLCLLGVGKAVFGQSDLASVAGRVMDPNGAVIIEATVTARNVDTGVETTVKTNEEGIYRFANLPPGNYEFTVSKRGFKEIVKPGVTLHLADMISMNFNMIVGELMEKVVIEAGAPMINTTDASVSTVVDQSYIANMPLNGRSLQDLILLTPGVVTQNPQIANSVPGAAAGSFGEFSVNGQRTESNYYTVDGVSGNVGAAPGSSNLVGFPGPGGAAGSGSVAASTALGTTQALVSVDDLQEFRVQSSTYSAEYGRNPGGQIAFQTKSGANQWHGSAYDYLRNGYFDAQDWFNDFFNIKEPAVHQNDFGGTFGGPVTIPGAYRGKDKTFFFVSYEGLRLDAPQPAVTNIVVPNACLRGTGACGPNESPAPAAVQPALNAFPLPSCPPSATNCTNDFGDGLGQFVGSWSNRSSLDSTSIRFDHAISDKLRLFFRFSNTTSDAGFRPATGFIVPSTNILTTSTVRTYTAGATSSFSSRWSNDFRLNYSSADSGQDYVLDGFGGSTPVDMDKLSGLGAGASAQFLICYNEACDEIFQQPHNLGGQRQWNVVDTVGLTRGRHQFKFGVDFRRLAPTASVPNPGVLYFYSSQGEVESNNIGADGGQVGIGQNSPFYALYKNFSFFGQDEWRATPRLTLSMGLRWEVNPPPGVTQGLMPYTLQGSNFDNFVLAPAGTPLWKTTWFNFAPRLGIAYIVRETPGWETVVRTGGGVFFDSGQQDGSQGFSGPGFQSSNVCFSDTCTAPCPNNVCPATTFPMNIPPLVQPIQNPPVSIGGSYGTPPVGFAPHLQLPYTIQWNASIQQALGKSQALTVIYVGSHASRLLQQDFITDGNNPNLSAGFWFVNNGLTADYGSLQTQFLRRLSQGLTAMASYTWSHCMDYGSANNAFGYQRGDCDYDVRHNFSSAFSYDLPSIGHGGLMNAVLHHWGLDDRLSFRTAFPITLEGAEHQRSDGTNYHAGLDLTGQPVYLSGPQYPGGKALNPQAFTNVSSGLGDAPRNFARLFGAWQMDMAVRREFPIYERLKLQFRAEAFNIFNHPNFGAVNDSCTGVPGAPCDSTFGQATASLAQSLQILNPLYQMGGPRSMQFTLRLAF